MALSNTCKGNTFEELYDLILREQLLHVCLKDLVLFPKSIDELTTLVDQYREARNVNIRAITVYT